MSHYTALRHHMAAAVARITEYAERPVIRVPPRPLPPETYSRNHLFTIRPSGREFVILDSTRVFVLCDLNGNTRQPTIAAAMNAVREYVARFQLGRATE